MARKLFLSYGRADDQDFVGELYARLTAAGFDVWYDRERMPNRGLSFTQEIRDEIDRCERLLLVAGPAALGSAYVGAEWQHALLYGRSVITILRLGRVEDLPVDLRLPDVPDFRENHRFDEALATLLRQLEAPPLEWAPFLTPVPTLPHPFIARSGDVESLLQRVVPDISGPAVVSGAEQTTAILGMPGIGKSVLAAAFARRADVRRAFQDGVAWITVGERHQVREALTELLLAVTPPSEHRTVGTLPAGGGADWGEVRTALARALRDRKLLIVVDDLWSSADLDVLRNALGRFCRLLITTRLASVAQALQARESALDLLSEEEALAFLAESAGDYKPGETVARALVRECGRLPLALAICGAKLKRGSLPEDLLDQIANANLEFLSAALPNYQYSDAYKAIHASVDALERDSADQSRRIQADLYLTMAVFPADQPLPESVVTMWWHARSGKSGAELREVLIDLADQAMLRLQGRAPNRAITLHDLQFDYVRARTREWPNLHAEFVEAYRRACGGNWVDGPDDGYFPVYIGRHLAAAGLSGELNGLLHTFEWLVRAVRSVGVSRVLSDFDLVPNGAAAPLRRALHQSAPAVAADATQLAGQLLGRLAESDDPQVTPLLASARRWRAAPWLHPLRESLLSPDSPLSLVLSGHEGRIRTTTCSPNGTILVSAGNSSPDRTIRIWDLATGLELHCLEHQAPEGFTPLAFLHDDERFLSAIGNEIRVWEWRSGKHVRTLAGHDAPIVAMAAARSAPFAASADRSGQIRFWDTETWQSQPVPSDALPCYAMTFSPDAGRFACVGDSVLEIYDSTGGKNIQVTRVRESSGFGFDTHWGLQPPLRFREDGAFLFWGRPLRYFDCMKRGYSPVDAEEQLIAQPMDVSSRAEFVLDLLNFPRLVSLDAERSVAYLIARGDDEVQPQPSRASITPDDRHVIVCGEDHRIEVWNVRRLSGIRRIRIAGCDQFLFSGDSRHLVVRSRGEYRLLSCDDGSDVVDPPRLEELRHEVERAVQSDEFSDGEERILARSAAGILTAALSRSKTGEYVEPETAKGERWAVSFRPAAGGESVVLKGHSLPVFAGVFFNEGRMCATAGQGRMIRIWDLPAGTQRFSLRGHIDTIFALAASADDKHPWILSCSHDRTARVWDYRRGNLIATFTADRSLRRAGASPDGRAFVAGEGATGMLHLLRLEL